MSVCRTLLFLFVTVSSMLFTLSASAQLAIIRVDKANGADSPVGQGNGWGMNAYRFLPDAIARANTLLSGNPPAATSAEIWVAADTYYPDESAASPGGSGNRNATFFMRTNVAILAGFDGTETDKNQRNHLQNVTILSGDLDENGDTGGDPYGDDSYHVVTADATSDDIEFSAVLDGFTITRGNASGSGMVDDHKQFTAARRRALGSD